ncbi:hypothetical protein [Bordetella genomosp. 13]|uniref:hypothetical protein n=1 Tax=Bordetella genomosp. 13 TaxID=463040 RepID=UPI00119FD892|nr:hypothetical protein [Bordetella genomosp. 13]
MKDRLRADLRAAMRDRRTFEAKVIRTLVAAVDNAEAPPVQAGQPASIQHRFHTGSAEVERLLLSESDVRRVLMREIDERERAAVELERLNMPEHAKALWAETLLAKRYLE